MRSSRRWWLAAELLLVVALAVFSARTVLDFSPDVRIRGQEFSYLIGSGAVADVTFDATGGMPLWNSWMGRGEPIWENSFSYANNPFMFLPVLAWGMNDGPKAAVALHAALAGVGGWMLAYVLGLKTGGRLLAGLLFAGAGGMVAAIGDGFYQISLSQTYVPWVYAGMLGTLRRRDRWPIGVLVVATSLLLFSGTFWYVLPTALGCGMLIAFHLVRRSEQGRWQIDRTAVERLAWATALIVLVSATRLIPQAIHHDYIRHPVELFTGTPHDFGLMLGLYFTTELPPGYDLPHLYYFYTIAPGMMLALLVGRLLIIPVAGKTPDTWRVVIPALLLWLFFTSWAQEGGAFWKWLYDTLPVLRQWRLVTRMMAAGAPFLILVAVIWFDDITQALLRLARSRRPGRALRWAAAGGVLILFAAGAWAALDVLANWERQSGTEPIGRDRTDFFLHERVTRPDQFISFEEWTFFGYLDHYQTLIRTTYGNPDYQVAGMPPTLGTVEMMHYPGPEAIEYHHVFAEWLQANGYTRQPQPEGITQGTRWTNADIPPYAFSVPAAAFWPERVEVLRAGEVTPVQVQYLVDTILVSLPNAEADEIVVVNEIAYPGWQVTVNGQPAELESVGELIGVRLAASTQPVEVTFTYRPAVWYVSSLITLGGAALLALYLLRMDERVRRWREKPTPAPAPEIAVIPAGEASAPLAAEESGAASETVRPWRGAITGVIVTVGATVALAGALLAGWLLRGQRNRRE